MNEVDVLGIILDIRVNKKKVKRNADIKVIFIRFVKFINDINWSKMFGVIRGVLLGICFVRYLSFLKMIVNL